ncbi:alpha-galactosidase, partial [bacterium]|nr:alpha-galactosidase [bacterium]
MTTGRDIRLAQGEWQVAFDPSASALACAHAASGAAVEGVLSFQALRDDGAEAWRIVPSRDDVADRLALLAPDGDVQGYLAASVRGGVLSIRVVHRAAQAYRGTLRFHGTARLGADTFACRTRAPEAPRVVQMAAGPADSRLNDSLFDVPTDAVLRLGGDHVSITTSPAEEGKAPAFGVALTARPETAARSALTFELERGYYRSRYVPHYSPIDKTRCPSPPTGWMSWNVYFDTAGEEENLAEARVGAEHLKPFGLEFWSVESWQDNSDTLPVSQFHNLTLRPHPGQFPHGMKWLADEIRALGFRPGVWTVPFGTGDEAFYAERREWFLHDADGRPLHNWCGRYVLDPSQPAVRQHMEDTHRTMAEDWGYEFFKIDGMSGRSQGYSAHFYERGDVRATFREPCDAPFALCVEALRRGIGPDRVWLACQGHYTGPEVPHADAGRIGADIVHPNQPPKWHNILHQAEATLNQLFAHNVVWYGDPDTLLVGEFLPLDVARIATIVVGLPGQVTFAGDKLAALPPERMRLLQQCLPVCDVRPLDLYPLFDRAPVWDLKVRRPFAAWDVVALFNWSDDEAETGLAFDELGMEGQGDYLLYDFWGERFLGAYRG